ncbi:MAG: serine protease [Anaeromyxobacteraceae bacterium]
MLASLLLALSLATVPATVAPPASAVLIQGGRWHGYGVVWGRGLVLTALHVVEDMPSVTVSIDGGPPRPARIADVEPALDLALLAVEGPLGEAPRLGVAAALSPGANVRFAGCPEPACGAAPAVVLEGSRAFAGARYLAIAAAVRPGASGTPVLDANGSLVGIVDLALARDGGIALAVPVERAAARFPRPGAAQRSP